MFHETLLRREDSVLVVVDAQERLMPAIHDQETVLRNIDRLIQGAALLDIPVLVTEQYPKGLGGTMPSLLEVLPPTAKRFAKMTFSAAGDETILDALEEIGRGQALVCGVEAHVCVLQTALDLSERGTMVQVAADACGSRNPANADNAYMRLRRESVVVTNTESALFEWLAVAGSEAFKQISRMVK